MSITIDELAALKTEVEMAILSQLRQLEKTGVTVTNIDFNCVGTLGKAQRTIVSVNVGLEIN